MVGRSSKILLPMIRIANTARPAYHAIRSTLPEDVPLWPVIGQDGQCLIHINEATLDRPKAMCQPSESYSDVILRLKSAHC
jgi:hypothetical protein